MDPPRPELLGLLRACKEEPEDDGPRLVLADWLEDQGDMTHARLIRLQCQAARMSHRERKHLRTEQRVQTLVQQCGEWLRPLREAGLTVVVERGLLSVTGSAEAAVGELANTEQAAWVASVGINGANWRLPELRRWLSSGLFQEATTLTLSGLSVGLLEAEALGGAELPLLRALSVYPHQITAASLRRLGQSPAARRLRNLSLRGSRITCDSARALASGSWDQLLHLDLGGNRISTAGAVALSRANWCARLTHLDLQRNTIGPQGVRALLTGPRAVAASAVLLNCNPIGDEGATLIASVPSLEAVQSLNLVGCDIGAEGAAALAASAGVANLTTLVLAGNRIGNAGATALAQSAHLGRLCDLYLSGNRIFATGARALAASPHLRNLKNLILNNNPINEAAREALRQRFGHGVSF